MDGDCSVTSAAELKRLMLGALASGAALRLDLESVEAIDISILQLLWVAGRDAARTGARIEIHLPEKAGKAAREAGFERFPGLIVQEG
jgi:hypothetical protein